MDRTWGEVDVLLRGLSVVLVTRTFLPRSEPITERRLEPTTRGGVRFQRFTI